MSVAAPELLDRRILAAVTFIDPTGLPVLSPVRVTGEGVRLQVKRPGELIVVAAPGLDDYAASFDLPVALAIGSVSVVLDIIPSDPGYLPRQAILTLPRDPAPANNSSPGSLFRAVEIALPPSPAAPLPGLAAGMIVTVRRTDDQRRVEGALVRLTAPGGAQAQSLTNAVGEAMLMVSVPLSSTGPGATVLPDVAATYDVIIDPALARFHADADLDAARAAAAARTGGFIDLDDLTARLGGQASAQQAVRVASGRVRSAAFAWTPP